MNTTLINLWKGLETRRYGLFKIESWTFNISQREIVPLNQLLVVFLGTVMFFTSQFAWSSGAKIGVLDTTTFFYFNLFRITSNNFGTRLLFNVNQNVILENLAETTLW